jgi:hypothetical protein
MLYVFVYHMFRVSQQRKQTPRFAPNRMNSCFAMLHDKVYKFSKRHALMLSNLLVAKT